MPCWRCLRACVIMTYFDGRDVQVVDVLPGAVLPELRLGDDDLLGHRRPQPRAATIYREAQERELTAAQLETRLVEAQLQALQRQLQPHFLFNTLNTISALMHRDVDAADAMIAQLSDLLRMSLRRVGVQEVPLKEELDFLRKYLEIEQTRFGDRLTVVIRRRAGHARRAGAQPCCCSRSSKTRIQHGIGPQVGAPGESPSRPRRTGAMLELDVQDNGVGLSAARLTDFNRGVGLSNTRSRLEHLYGTAHRFEFRQPAGRRVARDHRHSVRRELASRGASSDRAMEGVA